jgi:hypothetical protein
MSRRNRIPGLIGFESIRPELSPRWRTIMDLDFKTMTAGALTENAGSLTAIDGYQYHCRCGNAATFSATMTAGTGLVIDFAQSNNQKFRIDWLIQNYPRLSDGSFPRIRVTASASGIVYSHNSDYAGVGIMSYWVNNQQPYAPGVFIKYDCTDSTASPVTKKYGSVGVSNFGGTSSSEQSATTIASNNAASFVLSVADGGSGTWRTYGDDNTVDIRTGQHLHTYRNTMLNPYSTSKLNDSSLYWQHSDGSTGPVAALLGKNGSNGSQAITFERMVVEAYY